MEESKDKKLAPLKDAKGNILQKGDLVKILISEFNYPIGDRGEIIITRMDDGSKTWAVQGKDTKQGVTTYLNSDRAKDYEKI